MTEAARKAAQQAEDRLEKVAKNAREGFARVAEGSFTDKIKKGRFAEPVDHSAGQGRDEASRRAPGGPEH
ncbi:hypothetical protein [Micromonospora sp. KLBMP9576]|uniref:hypothetical protein n=1 Tax=Micromonospora sp. KLBMP9576 TaxID=3424769 RepID=UPI003D8AE3C5